MITLLAAETIAKRAGMEACVDLFDTNRLLIWTTGAEPRPIGSTIITDGMVSDYAVKRIVAQPKPKQGKNP